AGTRRSRPPRHLRLDASGAPQMWGASDAALAGALNRPAAALAALPAKIDRDSELGKRARSPPAGYTRQWSSGRGHVSKDDLPCVRCTPNRSPSLHAPPLGAGGRSSTE